MNLIKEYSRIKAFIIYNAPFEQLFTKNTIGALGNLICTKKKLNLKLKERAFGVFSVNVAIFTEAQNHNLFFNRKVVIDTKGFIRNHLLSGKSFGNISINSIESVISKADFQKFWYISKDNVAICKYCEFRYVCLDDRIDLANAEGLWYYKSECQYNPFIAKHNKQADFITVKEWQEQQK